MYTIKQSPEDFIVKEIFKPELCKGEYTYFILEKKNKTTIQALQAIAKKFRLKLKDFGYCGTKDKQAITTQYCSAKGKIEDFELEGIKVSVIGTGIKPLRLGDHQGNYFEIVLRDVDKLPEIKESFVNYFGEQRFSKNNVKLGEALLMHDFKKTALIISEGEGKYEKNVKKHLSEKPNDYVGAIKSVPTKILLMMIHSYQSLIWNKMAAESSAEEIPLIGIHSKEQIEGLSQKNFIIPYFPELRVRGTYRKRIEKASGISAEIDGSRAILKFTLAKGSYATEYVRQLFAKNTDNAVKDPVG